MEEVHGVDVSWLHQPKKGAPSREMLNIDGILIHSDPDNRDRRHVARDRTSDSLPPQQAPPPVPSLVTPAVPAAPAGDTTVAVPTPPTPEQNSASKPKDRRPSLGRHGSDKGGKDGPRRSSWLNNISSKFSSSQGTPEKPGASPAHHFRQPSGGSIGQPSNVSLPSAASEGSEEAEPAEPYPPSKPKDSSSFFSSLTRRLSSASQGGSSSKVPGYGGVSARRVLNVDPNRERCLVPEMDPSRLRKVAFCVDVEIAGGPRYRDDEDDEERQRRKKDFKMKERAEGEALKHPEALKEEKDNEGEIKLETKSKGIPNLDGPKEKNDPRDVDDADETLPRDSLDAEKDSASKKKEKKKRSEEERKERKEKRRLRAMENGSIPVEVLLDEDEHADTVQTTPPPAEARSPDIQPPLTSEPSATQQAGAALSKMDRPTTNPARIYRRCCQLRETPILKRITEQLMSSSCTTTLEPGIVSCLDLSTSRLQLADMITLGDWLAVVPVKQLRLEDADLNDEGLRCILAGLLAAKKPHPTKRRSMQPRHREGLPAKPQQRQAGVIERITLKNNPRLTRQGWKHINLFIYMCRSLKAIDLSMNHFPDTLPSSTHDTPVKGAQNAPPGKAQDTDAAEMLYKCLSERLGGSKLEELIVSECGLRASQIRKVVDGAVVCGIARLGLAGNHLDDLGLEHVVRYLKSGVCNAIDVGSNDMRGKLDIIANALLSTPNSPCWGLSLSGCNLDTESLKALFPALIRLPDFRFIDLSHNPELCGKDNGTISLFRRYLGQMKNLKRLHLADVGLSPKQAIALADALPDGPRLAHLNILGNKQLTALANARDEANQEEACALYASLMAAVRVSSTLICIDMDIPSQENSEIVKALAKQVVAYSLRNMEQFAIAEATGIPTANATAKLTEPHGGEMSVKQLTVPDVLMHLVGHVDGSSENHDNDEPAPDGDYIVGGTGVVKALQYVLGEKASDLRRTSLPSTPTTGGVIPRDRTGSFSEAQRGKAKKMSTNLLDSARKIRTRLQPALAKEAVSGDEVAHRRLLFLDQTLQSMIQRFEEEYPETRLVAPPSPTQPGSVSSSLTDHSNPLSNTDASIHTPGTDFNSVISDEEEMEDDGGMHPGFRFKRTNSDVSLASRALSREEGRLHRLGQHLRREVIDSPSTAEATGASRAPWLPAGAAAADEQARITALGERLEAISGAELRGVVESLGWEAVLEKVGGNYDDLRKLNEQDPVGWEQFKESQLKARMNVDRERDGGAGYHNRF